jgi:hypothetical protein
MKWQRTILGRVQGRDELTDTQLVAEFGLAGTLSVQELRDCLALFESEYGMPRGFLRPSDDILALTEPESTRNPIVAFFRRAAFEDRLSELNYRLTLKRRSLAAPELSQSPRTVLDYVRAWAGVNPPEQPRTATR